MASLVNGGDGGQGRIIPPSRPCWLLNAKRIPGWRALRVPSAPLRMIPSSLAPLRSGRGSQTCAAKRHHSSNFPAHHPSPNEKGPSSMTSLVWGEGWWAGKDSNLRRHSQQIYRGGLTCSLSASCCCNMLNITGKYKNNFSGAWMSSVTKGKFRHLRCRHLSPCLSAAIG